MRLGPTAGDASRRGAGRIHARAPIGAMSAMRSLADVSGGVADFGVGALSGRRHCPEAAIFVGWVERSDTHRVWQH